MAIMLVDDFDAHRSRPRGNPVCNVCGTPKKPEHPGVFRMDEIEFEGWFDVCYQCMADVMRAVGWIDADKAEELEDDNLALRTEVEAVRAKSRQLMDAHNAILGEIFEDHGSQPDPYEDLLEKYEDIVDEAKT